MRLIDISRPIASGAVVYPGDPPLEVERLCTAGEDSPCTISRLGGWTTHVLTHVDAPLHFVPGGATLDDTPLDRFVGEALVVEVEGDAVLPEHLPAGADLLGVAVLFKTRNSVVPGGPGATGFREDHVYVSAAAASVAVARRVNLVGIDYLSVDRYGDEAYPAHHILLGNGVLILEGLDLVGVGPGRYTLVALPLRIAGADGSPVRAALIAHDGDITGSARWESERA
jgi:arylformamidase